jgi:hypothetical protein
MLIAARRCFAALAAPCASSRYVDLSRCRAAAAAASAADAGTEAGLPSPAALGVAVHAGFLSAAEQDALLAVVAPALARRAFERGHWDGVIAGFREEALPLARAAPALRAAAARAAALLPPLPAPPLVHGWQRARAMLPQAHALELEERGRITRHVDSVKFSGGVIAGLCLASDAVMTLSVSDEAADEFLCGGGGAGAGAAAASAASASAAAAVGASTGAPDAADAPGDDTIDVLLPKGCLYVLSGEARYLWAHAIAAGAPLFRGAPVARGRRVSVMLRDELDEAAERPTPLAGSFAERVLRARRERSAR